MLSGRRRGNPRGIEELRHLWKRRVARAIEARDTGETTGPIDPEIAPLVLDAVAAARNEAAAKK